MLRIKIKAKNLNNFYILMNKRRHDYLNERQYNSKQFMEIQAGIIFVLVIAVFNVFFVFVFHATYFIKVSF